MQQHFGFCVGEENLKYFDTCYFIYLSFGAVGTDGNVKARSFSNQESCCSSSQLGCHKDQLLFSLSDTPFCFASSSSSSGQHKISCDLLLSSRNSYRSEFSWVSILSILATLPFVYHDHFNGVEYGKRYRVSIRNLFRLLA